MQYFKPVKTYGFIKVIYYTVKIIYYIVSTVMDVAGIKTYSHIFLFVYQIYDSLYLGKISSDFTAFAGHGFKADKNIRYTSAYNFVYAFRYPLNAVFGAFIGKCSRVDNKIS